MIRVLVTQCEQGLKALVPADASNGPLVIPLDTSWGPRFNPRREVKGMV